MEKLFVSSSPHIRSKTSTSTIMLDVIIALIPALIAGIYYFGFRAAIVTSVSVITCLLSEYIWQKICKKKTTVSDLSAVVTGMLLALNLPVSIPLWQVVFGGIFAINITKQLFGGIGHNFINPALAARAFLMASWPASMTKFTAPFTTDAVSSATVLQNLKNGSVNTLSLTDMFMGNMGGCIGETCAAALILGGLYLILRKVISVRIPLFYIGTVFIFMLIASSFDTTYALTHILSGSLFLCAIFMATDYVTSPVTAAGQIVFAIGCGLITCIIRLYGGYAEGVSYSIMLMNIVTPLIDRFIKPRKYGEVAKHA